MELKLCIIEGKEMQIVVNMAKGYQFSHKQLDPPGLDRMMWGCHVNCVILLNGICYTIVLS